MPNSPPQTWLAPGTCIGLYRVEQLISSGGFGVVYRVSRGGQQFALKLPLADRQGNGEDHCALEQRILREVVSLMTLDHPNIVKVHAHDRWPSPTTGALYLVMDFVEGVPLLEWRRNESPTIRELVELIQALALALDEMHRLGVVHRDIKSSNVLVAAGPPTANEAPARSSALPAIGQTERKAVASQRQFWKPMLVDFGLARPAFTKDVTREYVLLGTEGLWAPEHAAFGEAAFTKGARFKFTPATDLHALGLLFYQALTGRRALMASSHDFAAVVTEVVRPPSTVAPSLPEGLDGPLLRLLAKKPEERPLTGAALSAELDALLAIADERWDCVVPPGEPPPSKPPPAERSHAPTTPRRPHREPPPPKGPELAPAERKPPPLLERSAEVVPPEPSPPARTSTTFRIAVPPPPPPRKRQRLRRLVVVLACVVAVAFGAVFGQWAGSFAVKQAEPPARVVVASAAPPPSVRSPARVTRTPAASAATSATVPATSSISRPLPRQAAPQQSSAKGRPAEQTVVRAGVTRPVRVGVVEAVLREPLVADGLIVLPVGTAIVGTAAELPNGGFALRFDVARARNGETRAVAGSAMLDAHAGQRQPLRHGAPPAELEFDASFALSERTASR